MPSPGDQPTPLTTLAEGELGHVRPSLLPSGRAVLFQARGIDSTVAVYDFESEQRTDLVPGTTPQYAPTGHLVFWQDGSLWAARFDPQSLSLLGSPVLVVEGVASSTQIDAAGYTFSDDGTLIYLPSALAGESTLGWVNREGEMTVPIRASR